MKIAMHLPKMRNQGFDFFFFQVKRPAAGKRSKTVDEKSDIFPGCFGLERQYQGLDKIERNGITAIGQGAEKKAVAVLRTFPFLDENIFRGSASSCGDDTPIFSQGFSFLRAYRQYIQEC